MCKDQNFVAEPHLLDVCVDSLNEMSNEAKTGYRLVATQTNNFPYAEDLAILTPATRALHISLNVCEVFVLENYMVLNTLKSEYTFVPAAKTADFDTLGTLYPQASLINRISYGKFRVAFIWLVSFLESKKFLGG